MPVWGEQSVLVTCLGVAERSSGSQPSQWGARRRWEMEFKGEFV
jgi:hypothetical protein